jgi:hypothetical protein
MTSKHLYERSVSVFGKSWEDWAAVWYQWMGSIPKDRNPCVDITGRYSSEQQYDENVWFLAGTFGNTKTVKRDCTMPRGKSVLFPVLLKQDSFVNDPDLVSEEQLTKRATEATDHTHSLEVIIDGEKVENVDTYRARSPVFDLTFPENNVYDVCPGLTKAVCDGFWIFIRPLELGKHTIYFKGETQLHDKVTLNIMKSTRIYASIWPIIEQDSMFKLDVLYHIRVA